MPDSTITTHDAVENALNRFKEIAIDPLCKVLNAATTNEEEEEILEKIRRVLPADKVTDPLFRLLDALKLYRKEKIKEYENGLKEIDEEYQKYLKEKGGTFNKDEWLRQNGPRMPTPHRSIQLEIYEEDINKRYQEYLRTNGRLSKERWINENTWTLPAAPAKLSDPMTELLRDFNRDTASDLAYTIRQLFNLYAVRVGDDATKVMIGTSEIDLTTLKKELDIFIWPYRSFNRTLMAKLLEEQPATS